MRELLEFNRYTHDFAAAMWTCGSILIWMLCRESKRGEISTETGRVLIRFAVRLGIITIPSLGIALATGGVRAVTFRNYEFVGDITTSLIIVLIVKHFSFAVLIAWGISIHVRARRMMIEFGKS